VALDCRSKTPIGRTRLAALITPPRGPRASFSRDPLGRPNVPSPGTINSVVRHLLRSVLGPRPASKFGAVSAEVFKAKWYGFMQATVKPKTLDPIRRPLRATAEPVAAESGGHSKVPEDWGSQARRLSGPLRRGCLVSVGPGYAGSIRIAFARAV